MEILNFIIIILFVFKIHFTNCIDTDTTVILNCNHATTTNGIVEWQKDSSIIDQQNDKYEILSNGSLKIFTQSSLKSTSGSSSDVEMNSNIYGTYTCLVLTYGASQSAKYIQTIIQLNSIEIENNVNGFIRQPSNHTIQFGDDTILYCKPNITSSSSSTNIINYKWFKNAKLINFNKKYVLHSDDGSMEIKNVQIDDIGKYKCEIQSRTGFILAESKEAFLNVINQNDTNDAQFIIDNLFEFTPTDTAQNEYNRVLFECLTFAKYSNLVTVNWIKDGITLDFNSNDKIELTQSTNLLIKNASVSDSGSYTCRLCTRTTSVCDERTAYLYIHTKPSFTKQPKNLTKPINSDVLFECEVSGKPKPNVNWYKNGELINSSEYFQYINETSLRILGIIKQDEGFYQCIASNNLKTIISTAYLTVTDSDDNTEQGTGQDNQIIKLTKPVNVNLIKDARSIHLNWSESRLINANKQYVSSNDQAITYVITYVKTYENDKRRVRVLNTTKLNQIIDTLTPNREYQINVSAVYNSSIKSETVTFDNIKVDGDGDDATTHGTGTSAPFDINIEPLTNQIIKIKWKFNLKDNLLKFRLFITQIPMIQQVYGTTGVAVAMASTTKVNQYSEKYLDIYAQNLIVTNRNEFSFVLEDLKKYCLYRFRLIGYTKDKEQSRTSEFVEIKTQSDVPDAAPDNVSVDVLNSTAVKVAWDLPPLDRCNGFIIGYKLTLKFDDQTRTFYLDNEPTNFIIGQLTPGKKYSIRLLARNVNGTGPASDWLHAQTYLNEMTETRVPDQPVDLYTDLISDTSMAVRWTPPIDSNTTVIRRYLLKYGLYMPDNEVEIDANKKSFIIENLGKNSGWTPEILSSFTALTYFFTFQVPSSQYILSLKAGNNVGYGRELLKEVMTKRKSELNENEYLFPPLNLHANAISETIIDLSWTDWHLKDDEELFDERYYVVRYSIAETNKYKFKNSTERSVRIDELKSNTLYDFSVKLAFKNRESDWSLTTSQMTMEASQTNPPRDLRFKSEIYKNYVTTLVSWEIDLIVSHTPSNSEATNDLNTVYIVSYADEQSFKDNKWKQEYVNRELALVSREQNSLKMQMQLRKLKANTIYYIKIQERNSRGDFKSQSNIVLYKTPNLNGVGDVIIKSLEQKFQNKRPNSIDHQSGSIVKDNYLLFIVVPSIAFLILLIIILGVVIVYRKPGKKAQKCENNEKLLINTQTGLLNGQQTWLSCTNQTNSSTYGGAMTTTTASGTGDQCTSSSVISGPVSSSTTSTIKQQQQRLQLLIQNDDYLLNEQLQPLDRTNTSSPNDYLLQRSNCYQPDSIYLKQNGFCGTVQRKSFRNLPPSLLSSNVNNSIYAPPSQTGSDINQYVLQQQQKFRPYGNDSQSDMGEQQYAPSSHLSMNHTDPYCCHSPCSSVSSSQHHHSQQQQHHHHQHSHNINNNQSQSSYDKINTVLIEMNAANKNFSTKLKSFQTTNPTSQVRNFNFQMPPSSDNMLRNSPNQSNMFINQYLNQRNIDQSSLCTSTMVAPFSVFTNNSSIDNIYDKRLNNGDSTVEMTNLEGIMKDLTAITNKQSSQFQC